MSREVLGTLPEAVAAASLPGVGPSGGTATPVPGRTRLTSTRRAPSWPSIRPAPLLLGRRPTALAVAVALGIAAGWVADTAWRSAQTTDARLRTAGLSSVVIDAQHTGDTPNRMTADLTVALGNLGLVPVQLIGSEITYDAVAIVSIEPLRVTVPVNATRTAVLQVAVGCRSAQPLELPALQAQTPDGALLTLPTDGAGQALADLCDASSDADRVIRQVGVARDGNRLRVSLTAGSGRTTELQQVRAGGVRLDASPLPATVDGEVRTLWLEPPASCAPSWQRTGLPETIDLDVDVGADVTVTVPLGYALAAWLLDAPCRGGTG
jgi:hypothetical protein